MKNQILLIICKIKSHVFSSLFFLDANFFFLLFTSCFVNRKENRQKQKLTLKIKLTKKIN